MDVSGVTPHPFRVRASVPDEMVTLEAEDDWSAWAGVSYSAEDDRAAVVLVSIAVAPFGRSPRAAAAAAQALRTALRDKHPADTETVDTFTAADGNPAVRVCRTVTQKLKGRSVTTGQAQALVVFPRARALGVVSALCPDPADLERAAELVSAIAAGMTVTAATAAA